MIPDNYWDGTALHETTRTTNERDTEVSGFQTFGAWQVSLEETHDATGLAFDDPQLAQLPLTLDGCARVFAHLAYKNYLYLLPFRGPTPDAPDIYAYMAVLHNVGPKDSSIVNLVSGEHPMDWEAFKKRNAGTRWGQKISLYGDDCLPPAGWRPATSPPPAGGAPPPYAPSLITRALSWLANWRT